jgi:hypothetical protein
MGKRAWRFGEYSGVGLMRIADRLERQRSAEHQKQREAFHSVRWPEYSDDPDGEWEKRMKGRVFG